MWNSITGIITLKDVDELHLQAGAVEWAFRMATTSMAKLPGHGQEARVYTYLQHKQDDLSLFGFADPQERQVFLQLIKVSGVGPKQAMRILSGITPTALVQVLDDGDVDALKRVPGLGKATASKIILALRGKLTFAEEKDEETGTHSEIVDSLVNMGFDKKAAKKAVGEAVKAEPSAAEEVLFRNALMSLSQ